jgi:LmbE family N-acetylglucosaminyl deacetylase
LNILVVAAHPDDEILGCGGAIARHVQQGDRVAVVILGEGVTSRSAHGMPDQDLEKLRDLSMATQRACAILGVRDVALNDFPDNRMDSLALLDVVKLIEVHIARVRPTVIYTHHGGDVNIDHQVTYQAVVTACRPQPGHPVRTLLTFETLSSTEWQPPLAGVSFAPNWFVDINETLALKLAALDEYVSELRPWPHPRSISAVEHLARWRGSMVGLEAAEAFALARTIR